MVLKEADGKGLTAKVEIIALKLTPKWGATKPLIPGWNKGDNMKGGYMCLQRMEFMPDNLSFLDEAGSEGIC